MYLSRIASSASKKDTNSKMAAQLTRRSIGPSSSTHVLVAVQSAKSTHTVWILGS